MTTDLPGGSLAAGLAGTPDTASEGWVARLRCLGAERDAAVAELHVLLLRAVRFEIRRRRAAFPHLAGMRAHLLGCPACSADYESLRALLLARPGGLA